MSGKIIRIEGQDDPADYGIDEIVAENVSVHLERMNDGHIWIGIEYGNDKRLSIQLQATAKGRLEALVEDDA